MFMFFGLPSGLNSPALPCYVFFIVIASLALLVHPVVGRYCDGRWVDTGSTRDPFMDYSLNAAHTRPNHTHPKQAMQDFLRDACPSQSASYNCYMTSKDSRRVDKLSEIHFVPYDREECPPFSPAAFVEHIRGRRVVVIGDSVVSQIFTSLICATYKTGTTHHHVYMQFFGVNGHHMRNAFVTFKESNASLMFQKVFKPSDANWLSTYNHHKLTHDDIVVLGFGLHHNTQEHFRKEMEALVKWINEMRDPPHFLLLHSTPQHAVSENGYYVRGQPLGCVPIPRLNESVLTLEEDAKTPPKRHDKLFSLAWRATMLEEIFAPLVERKIAFIAPISIGLNARHDAHMGPEDCTHWCFPSDIFKYVHLMIYNALRRMFEPLPLPETEITQDVVPQDAHNATANKCDELWKAYPALRNGNLIKFHRERSIYLVHNGCYREFATWGAFVKHGFDMSQVETTDRGQIGPMPLGDPITVDTVLPNF